MLVVLIIDYFLRNKFGRLLGLFIKYIELWKTFLQFLAIILNVLIILSYNVDRGSRLEKPSLGELDDDETKNLLRIFGIINLLLAFIVVGVLLFQRVPYNIQKYRVREQDSKKRLKDTENIINDDLTRKAYNRISALYQICSLIFSDMIILYHLLYFIFTVLGVAFHPFFFAF